LERLIFGLGRGTSWVETAHRACFLSDASRFGHSLIDRQLYLPKNWAEDPERRSKAGVQDDVVFRAKGKMIG